MPGHSTSSVRTDFVTQGTYNVFRATDSGIAWTDGTEYESTRVSNQVLASGKDELYSWVRGQFLLYSVGSPWRYEWFVVRMNSADALPDFDTSSEVEVLQKEKRIYARGMIMAPLRTYSSIRTVKFELYNVKLRDGEELRLIIKPYGTVADGVVQSVMEWRKVGY